MNQTMVGSYTVDEQEHVTIEVVATKVAEFAKASLDGSSLAATGHAPLRFEFDVTKSSGQTHFVVIRVVFDSQAPDDAQYQILVQGSNGGGQFSDFTILKSDPSLSKTLDFTVN